MERSSHQRPDLATGADASTGLAPHPYPSRDIRPESDVKLGHHNRNPAGISFWRLVKEDFETHDRDILAQGFWAIFTHRFGNWRMGVRPRILRMPFSLAYAIMQRFVEWVFGISLAYTVVLGRRVRIWHQGGMQLGALEIGDDVHIRQNTTFGVKRRGDPRWMKPVIEAGCDVGAGALIVGAVRIGSDSVIGGNVVIAKDVPSNSIVTVPPPIVRTRSGTNEAVPKSPDA